MDDNKPPADQTSAEFLTTEANAEVGAVDDKAMPVILTTAEQTTTWLTAPWRKLRACNARWPTERPR